MGIQITAAVLLDAFLTARSQKKSGLNVHTLHLLQLAEHTSQQENNDMNQQLDDPVAACSCSLGYSCPETCSCQLN
jgi:hypothetical protein